MAAAGKGMTGMLAGGLCHVRARCKIAPNRNTEPQLGPTARCPFLTLFLGRVPHTKIDYRKKGTLILTSPLEDLVKTKTKPKR